MLSRLLDGENTYYAHCTCGISEVNESTSAQDIFAAHLSDLLF